MKIELKNIKHHKSLSEETNAFTGTVYIDGKRVAEAMNRGHGEPISFHPLKKGDQNVIAKAEEYLDGLPPLETQFGGMKHDLELVIGALVERDLIRKEIARHAKRMCGPKATKTYFYDPDGNDLIEYRNGPDKLVSYGGQTDPAPKSLARAEVDAGRPNSICLNTLYAEDPEAAQRRVAQADGILDKYDWSLDALVDKSARSGDESLISQEDKAGGPTPS